MVNRIAAVALLCFAVPPVQAQVGPTQTPATWAAVDSFVRSEMVKQRVPGLAMAVVRNGVLVRAQGYGVATLEHNVPVTASTIFQSGSVGKQFTATLIMQLVGEGKLSLDDRLTKFFPSGPASWRDITIRQMLSHTSGISEKLYEQIDLHLEYPDSTIVRLIGEAPLNFPPGSKWSYSNPGYVLLGFIIKQVTGRFYGDLLKERIFGPLGMTTAMVIDEAAIVPNRAAGYESDSGRIVNQTWVARKLNTTADGALYLTVLDLAKWDAALYGNRVLPQSALAQMWTPITLTDGTAYPYGFGWALGNVNGHRIIEHGGSWQGFKAYIARYVGDGLTVIVLMNFADAKPELFAHGIAGVIEPALVAATVPSSTLIENALIIDGTGSPARAGAVRIDGGRIVEIGALKPKSGEAVVDAKGRVLAPGFIDVHSHHDDGLFEMRDATPVVSQGITTIVAGQDGSMTYPVRELFSRMQQTRVAINVATFVGHGDLRSAAMGKDNYRRHATAKEIEQMRRGVADGMAAGALGLATGLEYDPGIYSASEEVITLAKEAAKGGGRYISHVRSEDREFWAAIDEIIRIGREAKIPVEVTHIKLAMKDWWGQSDRLLGILNKARADGVNITADIYPYEYWHSDLTVLFPKRDFKDRPEAEFVLEHVTPADGIVLTTYSPEPALVGKTLAEIAAAKKTAPADELLDLIARSRGENDRQSIMGRGMIEKDIDALIQWPYTSVCSDGSLESLHPRGRGAFTKVLRTYVREKHLLSLEEAIRKMTSLSAANVGIADRGVIRPGAYADLVLFDPATVGDRSTFEDPRALSVGIERVWVNGMEVWREGTSTGAFPGQAVRRP